MTSTSIYEAQSRMPPVALGIGKFTIEGLLTETVSVHTEQK